MLVALPDVPSSQPRRTAWHDVVGSTRKQREPQWGAHHGVIAAKSEKSGMLLGLEFQEIQTANCSTKSTYSTFDLLECDLTVNVEQTKKLARSLCHTQSVQ
jgi:hypothetical protein